MLKSKDKEELEFYAQYARRNLSKTLVMSALKDSRHLKKFVMNSDL